MNTNQEEIPYWKQQEIEAKKNQEIKKRYPDLGKIVKYDGEYGVVLFSPDFKFDINEQVHEIEALCVRWDTKKEYDFEQYGFFDYEYIDSYDFKHINMDGTLKNK